MEFGLVTHRRLGRHLPRVPSEAMALCSAVRMISSSGSRTGWTAVPLVGQQPPVLAPSLNQLWLTRLADYLRMGDATPNSRRVFAPLSLEAEERIVAANRKREGNGFESDTISYLN